VGLSSYGGYDAALPSCAPTTRAPSGTEEYSEASVALEISVAATREVDVAIAAPGVDVVTAAPGLAASDTAYNRDLLKERSASFY
jgi:hypothetical protein